MTAENKQPDERAAFEAFEAWSDGYDHESDEWLDMGADDMFVAGFLAARATTQQANKGDEPIGEANAPASNTLRIVCAANRKRFTGEVVLGIRHWDEWMTNMLDAEGDPVDQGFIDNKGNFLSRKEAWKVAYAAGQIIKRVGGDDKDGGTLYSENLY